MHARRPWTRSVMILSLAAPMLALAFTSRASAQDVVLSVSENPCFIQDGATKCATTISWETPVAPGRIAIRIVNHNTSRVWQCPLRGPGSFFYDRVAETPKTIEAYLVGENDCSHPDDAAEDAFFDALEPAARLPVFGIARKIFADPQQCILRGGESKCDVGLRWAPGMLPPGRDRVQIRFVSATIPGAPVSTWKCFDPATGPSGDSFPFATRNGKIVSLLATTGCDGADPDTDLLDSMRVRGIPEMHGVYFITDVVPTPLPAPAPAPGEMFSLTTDVASYPGNRWPEIVLDPDPAIQASIDHQLREDLAATAGAGAGFNLIYMPNREIIPWPDTENGESVADIAGDIRHGVDKLVHIVELAAAEGLMSAFNFHHFCQIPTSVTVDANGVPLDPDWAHQGGSCINGTNDPGCARYLVCGDDNIDTALDWYQVIFDHFAAELEARGLFNDLAYVNPVARFRRGEGGDIATAWTELNPYIDHTREYLREVMPKLQQMTDIPITAGMSLRAFEAVEDDRYRPVDDYWSVVPHAMTDFLYLTTYFDGRKLANGPISIDPVRVLAGYGGPASKLNLTDWKLHWMAEASVCAGAATPDPGLCQAARDFVICRTDCSVAFHRDFVPEAGMIGGGAAPLGLAGTWFIGYREAYSQRHATAPPGTSRYDNYLRGRPGIGLRQRNCIQSGGGGSDPVVCTFNDPDDWLVLDAFTATACPPPGVCVEP